MVDPEIFEVQMAEEEEVDSGTLVRGMLFVTIVQGIEWY